MKHIAFINYVHMYKITSNLSIFKTSLKLCDVKILLLPFPYHESLSGRRITSNSLPLSMIADNIFFSYLYVLKNQYSIYRNHIGLTSFLFDVHSSAIFPGHSNDRCFNFWVLKHFNYLGRSLNDTEYRFSPHLKHLIILKL